MKRFSAKALLSLVLAFMLVLSLGVPALAAGTAAVSRQKLTVDGKAVECEKYAIGGYNYFKLRDLAMLLNGTNSQFAVDFDGDTRTVFITTGEAYTPVGGELNTGKDNSATCTASEWKVEVNGESADISAYALGGYNFFKLRDLGKAIGFYVHYDEATDTAVVDQSEEDEAWDTGDASLDNPRNQDGIGEKEILVVSFGTSFNDSRRLTIGAIEAAMEKAFPAYSVRRGFTANIIIDHVKLRDDVDIDDLKQALDRAVANGVKELVVAPTHLMDGFEYNDILDELKSYESKFEKLIVSDPLLTSHDDYDAVIKAITEDTAQFLDGETAICFMGHGTEAASNHVYADLQAKLTAAGYKDYFVGTVEATPTFQEVVDQVKAAGYKKVILEPLMIVAGDHANNDMADPEDEESWYSLFKAAGIEPTARLKGLGEFPAIQALLVSHVKAAIDAAGTLPSRDIADASDMTTVKDVEEEGMTPVTADKIKDGTYDISAKSSSSMFRVQNPKLTVADGKMTVTFTTTKTYTWFFMGPTDKIAGAADSEFLRGTETDEGMSYTISIEALDEGIACAAYSKNKDQWYARTLLFRADSLPAEALVK